MLEYCILQGKKEAAVNVVWHSQSRMACLLIECCNYITYQGDLREYLRQRGALRPIIAVKFALDIARLVFRLSAGSVNDGNENVALTHFKMGCIS